METKKERILKRRIILKDQLVIVEEQKKSEIL